MKRILNFAFCAALLAAGLSGCEKIDVNKLEGTWSEQYDPTVFAMDGSVEFTSTGTASIRNMFISWAVNRNTTPARMPSI